MAISSVARKATVKKDNTLLQTMQLVGQQKALADRMKLQARKQMSDEAAARRKTFEAHIKRIDSIESPKPEAFADVHNQQMQQVNALVYDPTVPETVKDRAISAAMQYTNAANTFNENAVEIKTALAGDEEKRKIRSEEGIVASIADYYLDEEGNPKDITALSKPELMEHLDNDIRTHNVVGQKQDYLDRIEDVVAETISATNMKGDEFAQLKNTKTSGDFLKIENGKIVYDDNGRPTIMISGEQVAGYKKYKGLALELEAIKAEEGNENMTDADAMELALRRDGFLTEKVETDVDFRTRPQDTEGKGLRRRMANADTRAEFLQTDVILGDGKKTMGILNGLPYAVPTATWSETKTETVDGEEKTTQVPKSKSSGVEEIEGGKRYTVIFDRNQKTDTPLFYQRDDGSLLEIPLKKDKANKYVIREIDVMDKNPQEGLMQLSALYNNSVDSKNRVDHIDFLNSYNKLYPKERENPFPFFDPDNGEGEETPNPFGDIFEEK